MFEFDDIIDKPFKILVSDSEWDVLKKGEKRKGLKGLKGLKGKRDKKGSSLVPVRKIKNSNNSPTGTLKNICSRKETAYKLPSIVTLNFPEPENNQMHNTVKEGRGFMVDSLINEKVMRSMVDTQGPKEELKDIIPIKENKVSQEKLKRPASNPQK